MCNFSQLRISPEIFIGIGIVRTKWIFMRMRSNFYFKCAIIENCMFEWCGVNGRLYALKSK